MKNFILINGTMGAGKTTVSRALQKLLPQAVFLDGDWCWDSDPFLVTDETKKMVLENIAFLLSQFLACKAYQNVIFCWVMHEQEIIDRLLGALDTEDCQVRAISLVCSREALAERLQRDIRRGIRREDVLERSMGRLHLYGALKTIKMDVSAISPEETAEKIMALWENRRI